MREDNHSLCGAVASDGTPRVDGDDVVDVPEDLFEKVRAPLFGDDVCHLERVDPHIPQVLHIAHEIALGVDDLVDGLLSLLFRIRYAVRDLFGDGMDPERPRLFLSETENNVLVMRYEKGCNVCLGNVQWHHPSSPC